MQWRIIKAGIQNFIRNFTLAVAAIVVMVITLTIILFSLVANVAFNNTVQQITDKIDISVYLKDDINSQNLQKLQSGLAALPNVKSVTYKSKEEVKKSFGQEHQSDVRVAWSQADNSLPATIIVKPRDPNKIQEIKNYLDQPEITALQSDPTSYSGVRKDAIDNIARATKFFREAGVISVIVFALVSMLIIFNTIRMAIFNRRDELTIMRLLGASNWYIRGPFVVETILYGIISAVLSVSLISAFFMVSASTMEASSFGVLDLQFANDYFTKHFWPILAAQLGIGLAIGIVSSLVATRRYLKFKSTK
jgi:cell division transport system permease protein